MKRTLIAMATAAALGVGAAPSHGQVSLGVAGGPASPTGGFDDFVGNGVHGGLVADVGLPLIPVGIRGDLMVKHLPGIGGHPSYQQASGVVNATLDVLPVPLISTYLTAGAGLYATRYGRDDDGLPGRVSIRTDLGLNGGIGARVNLLVASPFVEVRYHRVGGDPTQSYIPVTFGIFF